MELKTKAMGTVTVTESQLVSIPEGLYGFEAYTKFALIESEHNPFQWLQSAEKETLAFLVIDPFIFCPEYELDIDDESLKRINVFSPSDVTVLTIVTVPSDGEPVTANLQGPLIINKNNHLCMQVIASDPRWQTKHDIVAEVKKRGLSC